MKTNSNSAHTRASQILLQSTFPFWKWIYKYVYLEKNLGNIAKVVTVILLCGEILSNWNVVLHALQHIPK